MKVLIILFVIHLTVNDSIQKPSTPDRKQASGPTTTAQDLKKLQELLRAGKLLSVRPDLKMNSSVAKSNFHDLKNSSRKSKTFPFFPLFPSPSLPFGISPGFLLPQNKQILTNSYPPEWLSRTEPFKKNPLLDSPTYYIRLPPNPYIFVPGIGYVSRPPALSDPELLDSNKAGHSNELGHGVPNSFYKVPIDFISNGKPTSVYQLASGQTMSKPESPFINLTKGPYVFNGKPNEIYLVAQIYDALYGDELSHFYP